MSFLRSPNLMCGERAPNGEQGTTMVLIAVMAVGLIGVTAISVEISLARVEHRRIEFASDASALAGALQLLYIDSLPEGSSGSSEPDSATLDRILMRTIGEAEDVLEANGVVANQLTSVTIEVGNWDDQTRCFIPGGTPWDAVSVSAQRTVSVGYSRALGWNRLRPTSRAIATLSGANDVTCVIPFGIERSEIEGKTYGDTLHVGFESPGNWGKLDIDGNMSSATAFLDGFLNGVCSREVSVGDQLSPGTGFAGVRQGFSKRAEEEKYTVTIAIVDGFGNGNSEPVTVIGFIVAEILTHGHSGKVWSGELKFLNDFAGSGAGGPVGDPFATSRVLVNDSGGCSLD